MRTAIPDTTCVRLHLPQSILAALACQLPYENFLRDERAGAIPAMRSFLDRGMGITQWAEQLRRCHGLAALLYASRMALQPLARSSPATRKIRAQRAEAQISRAPSTLPPRLRFPAARRIFFHRNLRRFVGGQIAPNLTCEPIDADESRSPGALLRQSLPNFPAT